MAKSYKVCLVSNLDDSKWEVQPYRLRPQYSLQPTIPEGPSTRIFRARDRVTVGDFQSYQIEHEHEVEVAGRVNNTSFSRFIRKGIIDGFYSESRRLLLLSGKKVDILDFCRKTSDFPDLDLSTISVNMSSLQEKLSSVRLVWFRLRAGYIRASALMGMDLQKTVAFSEGKARGEITTLSFLVEKNDEKHAVMVTEDGAIVLQAMYPSVSEEIDLVMLVKESLLDGIFEEESIRRRGKRK